MEAKELRLKIEKAAYNRVLVLAVMILAGLGAIFVLASAAGRIIDLLGVDFGPLGWHDVDSDIFNLPALAAPLLLLYTVCVWTLAARKRMPPKPVIWTAYFNLFLFLAHIAATK